MPNLPGSNPQHGASFLKCFQQAHSFICSTGVPTRPPGAETGSPGQQGQGDVAGLRPREEVLSELRPALGACGPPCPLGRGGAEVGLRGPALAV